MDIGFQLYSARNYPFADVLKTVAALGYTQVEGYGALYADDAKVAELSAALSNTGLLMPTDRQSSGGRLRSFLILRGAFRCQFLNAASRLTP